MLDDLKAVTVDYLGGVVVGKLGGSGQGQDWLPLDKWTTLDEQTLCHKRGRPGFTMRSRASDWCSRGSQASGGPPSTPNTAAAAERGVFGSPTMFVGEEMFFGNDRLDFMTEALRSAA